MNRYPLPYSQFMFDNFVFTTHKCGRDCSCHKLGCTQHWTYGKGKPPDREQMRKTLATWQAFRNKPGCQDRFLDNFHRIAELVKPVSDLTLFCTWRDCNPSVADIYDETRAILSDSTVCATKTLHFFAPDMFIILDREQVFRNWKDAMRRPGFSLLSGSIDTINGAKYASLLSAVKSRLGYFFENGLEATFGGRDLPHRTSVDSFRYATPIIADDEEKHPNTVAKVLDNIMRGTAFEP